ncbi:uncharacterized protein LOC133738160 isoform X3 [Rosa rugosa]|uniref:uncharacterized protein LOC133738160 isoform X3 n=1 Tax=Rosa rugosa TaxID=74645 RepID=UPI002B40CDF5|nr:uncharacterized protein LOC133738160 isoform X3 [Rosa rugosa]XP_062021593.1 uncharacterized protein LOC133738160 isoform X3 [Rosa rugosa]
MFKCAQEDGFGFSLMQGPEILDLDSIPFPERAMSLAFDILNDLVKVRPSAVLHDICLPVMLLPNNMCALVGSANQYKGIGDCVQTIVREEGPPALLKVSDATAADPKLLVFLKSVNMVSRNNRFSFLISLLQLVLRKLDRNVPS